MTYEMMEANLVQRIAELRNSEQEFENSFEAACQGAPANGMNAAYRRIHLQMAQVEQLLSKMEALRLKSLTAATVLPADAGLQTHSSLWA